MPAPSVGRCSTAATDSGHGRGLSGRRHLRTVSLFPRCATPHQCRWRGGRCGTWPAAHPAIATQGFEGVGGRRIACVRRGCLRPASRRPQGSHERPAPRSSGVRARWRSTRYGHWVSRFGRWCDSRRTTGSPPVRAGWMPMPVCVASSSAPRTPTCSNASGAPASSFSTGFASARRTKRASAGATKSTRGSCRTTLPWSAHRPKAYPVSRDGGRSPPAALLNAYGRIEDFPVDAGDWGDVRRSARLAAELAVRRAEALLVKRLATLRDDLPIDCTLPALEWRGLDEGRLAKVVARTEANELWERIERWSG